VPCAGEQPGSGNSEGQHADLLGRVSELEQVASGEMVDISGERFNSVADVQAWLIINEVDTSALAWDLFSVLVAAKPKGCTGQERDDETYSAIRTRTSVAENDLVASMSHVRPLLLYGKKSELAPLSEGFAACKSYSTWSGNLLSYKNQLNGYIRDFCAGLRTNLRTQGTSPRMIGYALLTNVENQWTQLCQYMDELTMELTAEAKFGKEKA
jgi:hypothetical protein